MVTIASKTTKPQPKPQRSKAAGDPAEIAIELIDLHPANPREKQDAIELEKLSISLDREGVLQRPILRSRPGGRYQLLAGSRRFTAAKLAGWKTLPVEIRDVDDVEALIILGMENVARKELNPLETGRLIETLNKPIDEGGAGKTLAEIAALFSKSSTHITYYRQLLTLPKSWQKMIASGEIAWTKVTPLFPYVDRPEILAAVESEMKNNPDAWQTFDSFRANVNTIAEGFGMISAKTNARRFSTSDVEQARGKTAKNYREVAAYFKCSVPAISKWKSEGAPVNPSGETDLAAVAEWLRTRRPIAEEPKHRPQLAAAADRGQAVRRAAPAKIGSIDDPPRLLPGRTWTDRQISELLTPVAESNSTF